MTWLRYLNDVTSLEFDVQKCTGCGRCIEVCPHGVFVIDHKKVRITDRNACMECGACARNCRAEAVTVAAGVGCATAVIKGALQGGEPTCGCDCCNS